MKREAAVWHPFRSYPRTFSFPLEIHEIPCHKLSGTLYPLTPRHWAARFDTWRYFHQNELAEMELDERDVNFSGPDIYNPEPQNPQAFAVWLEWLDEHEERRFHWERWRERFADCIEAGARFEAGADESELRGLLESKIAAQSAK